VLKAELHCHIEGAASPDLVIAQARRYGEDWSAFIRDGTYVWDDFTSFLSAYDFAAAQFRSAEDYALLAEDHLISIAAAGAIYGEFFISIDHARNAGLDPCDYVAGLAKGIERARNAKGIEARMIVVGLRHLGPERVEEAVRWVVANPHPLITGWGMAGEERMHHPRDFARAFDMAREAGLGITVHAGELAGWESVAAAMDHLKPDRIGHGVRAIENPDLVSRIADEGIVLECCPGSNIALKVFPEYSAHPFPQLRTAGCKITLNSDDPPFFATSLDNEYRIARDYFGLDDTALRAVTRTAIEAAFVDAGTRMKLIDRLG
jgi:adenosine deaminase